MALSTIRHDEIFKAHEHNDPIHLIGAGAIGSRVWTALVELGLTNLTVYDFDKVEAHNLANQIYGHDDVGLYKVQALNDWTQFKLGNVPNTFNLVPKKVTKDSPFELQHTVILAVDTVAARKELIEMCVEHNVYHVFDTRMASTHGNIIYVNPNNPIAVEKYINELPDEALAETSACGTSLTVGTTATLIANLAVWQLMHQRSEPAAHDKSIEIYFKPLCLSTGG